MNMTSSNETNMSQPKEEKDEMVSSSDQIVNVIQQQQQTDGGIFLDKTNSGSPSLATVGLSNNNTTLIGANNGANDVPTCSKYIPYSNVITDETSTDVTYSNYTDMTEHVTHQPNVDSIQYGTEGNETNIKVEPDFVSDQVEGFETEHDNMTDINNDTHQPMKQEINMKDAAQNDESFTQWKDTADQETGIELKNPTVSLCRLSQADVKCARLGEFICTGTVIRQQEKCQYQMKLKRQLKVKTSKRSIFHSSTPTLDQSVEKLFRCNICYESFFKISDLSKHNKGHAYKNKS
ncbi:unnamed protein product, partial [Owenia fusiformis]